MVDEGSKDRSARLEGALHDVANALTVVLGWLELAEDEAPIGSRLERAVRLARERGQHGRAIALRAVQGSRHGSEHGSRQGPPESSRACEAFVQDVVHGIEPQARQGAVLVRVHVAEDARFSGVRNSSRALQVLTNLLMNAVSFTPENGAVTFEASRLDDGMLLFLVRDEGPGFDAERAKRVFDGLESTRRGGSGIGLRHASWLVQQEGGSLRLAHAGPGAVFELTWPSVVVQAAEPRPSPRRGIDGMRLLVIEDDLAVSMLLEAALGAKGALVDTVSDQEALALRLAKERYDVALVDLSPLEPDVPSALARIRGSRAHPNLVLITGSAVAPSPAMLAHASAWVRKPFEIGDVVAALVELPR